MDKFDPCCGRLAPPIPVERITGRGCVCTTSARSQRPCNDIHGPVVVVLGVAVWNTPLWSSWTLVVVGWSLPFL